jgi:hypothetical protein
MEASLRRRALAALRRGRAAGDEARHVAAALGLDPERLRAWQHEHDERVRTGLRPAPLGRKPLSCDPTTATEMRHHLAVFGPGVGTRELHREFPDVSYRDCAHIAWRFRRDLKDQFEECEMTACTWTTPGTVWAADVWQPALPVDGQYPYILDVRDLASGCMLESMPLERCTVELVSGTLERLYSTLGAPLAIKTDNGSEFVGEGSAEMHDDWGVEQLRSPPYLPSYNGACEAGHGSIRYRAEMLARRDGRPGRWSLDHLEGARAWANDLVPPHRGGRPLDLFATRARITAEQRASFRDAVARVWGARWRELFVAAQKQERTITLASAQPTVSRVAISATLRNLGYLTTRSVPIRQEIPYLKTGSISQ